MAVTQNTYTGDGATVLFSFTFPYLETTDIKVSLNGVITTAYTLANATTIQFSTAPTAGAVVQIYRVTDDSDLAATFYPGSAIRSQDLNENFTQNLYVTQESNREAEKANQKADYTQGIASSAVTTANNAVNSANQAVNTANSANTSASSAVTTANAANTTAASAVTTANNAVTTANGAVSTANTATTTAQSAVTTANTASSNATTAVSTANSAVTTAQGAVTTANAAASDASNAVTTANAASAAAATAITTANGAVTTANTANSTSSTALTNSQGAVNTALAADTKADQAITAVANAILYDLIANVASIPATPSNNDAIEVQNSTGIQSFTPLSGLPSGFVGDSGLAVRLVYSSATTSWVWIQYFPSDPETRYGDAITALETDVGVLQTDVSAAEGDITTLSSDVSTLQSDVLVLNSAKLALAGGTMTGALNMGSNRINGVTNPTSAQDAATKNYVDTALTGIYAGKIEVGNTAVLVTDNGVAPGVAEIMVDGTSRLIVAANGANLYPGLFAHNTIHLVDNNVLALWEADANGNSYVGLKAPASLAATSVYILPPTTGSSGQVLSTDGTGILSWYSIPTFLVPSDIGVSVQAYDSTLLKSADFASQIEAEAGTSSTKVMTPQRTLQAINANKSGVSIGLAIALG
jgi:hypothetical protein